MLSVLTMCSQCACWVYGSLSPVSDTDEVLYNLIWMGMMDWTRENAWMNQSIQAMCLATALASWIIQIANANCANISVY